MLDKIYHAGWRDIENLTVFFDVSGDEIMAGGYNIATGQKTSRRRLISANKRKPYTPYTYTQEGIERAKSVIKNA
jgi:hypothetical protein